MVSENQTKMLISAACNFQGNSLKARELARNTFREKENNNENILRILADGLIAHLSEKLKQQVPMTNEKISYQIGLSCSFIRTHFLVMDFILNGDLVEALTLSRKQLENLTRLHEIDAKPLNKLFKKTPNISNVLKGGPGRLYGSLSEVAHFATPRVTELLHVFQDDGMIGPSLLPQYGKQSHACADIEYFIVVYFLGWFIEKLTQWYPGETLADEKQIFTNITNLALACGVIRLPEEKEGKNKLKKS